MEILNLVVYENGVKRDPNEDDIENLTLFESKTRRHYQNVSVKLLGKVHLCEYCPVEKFMSCPKVRFGVVNLTFINYAASYRAVLDKETYDRYVVFRCSRYSDIEEIKTKIIKN